MNQDPPGETRRDFITQTAAAAAALAAAPAWFVRAAGEPAPVKAEAPWYRRTLRWGQTNITEIDPARYDIDWWRGHWTRTGTQGVIVNAGGIVAYYPSRVLLHRPAEHLGGRDLFGELCRAAHETGLVVFARMDSNRAHEEFHRAHPDWFAVDASGRPHKAGELFVTCVNSPYYDEHIPAILREIAERYHPEGFTDNSWSGLGRGTICYCENCRRTFRRRSGEDIPRGTDWNDPVYREWIRWNYDRRLEIWDLNNRATRAAGGPDCIWAGMNSGSVVSQCQSFRDCKAICERADIIMLDHQSRNDATGFQHNGEAGKLVHGLLGWEKLVPESMAMYQAGRPTFRLASKPAAEARIPYLPVHADHIDRDASRFSALVLPNLGAMSDTHVASVGRFVASGGGLLATGESSMFDQGGDPRQDFALADVFGAHLTRPLGASDEGRRKRNASDTAHTYLRLAPERRALVDGPHAGNEPAVTGTRHPVLRGFDETDILPFGGVLESLRVDAGAEVLATFVPAFPIYPPETAWMREPKTGVPGLILNAAGNGARVAFLPADLDRRFARDYLPDHGDLLANLVRWVAKDDLPLSVEGPGLVDCHLYRQPGRVILHLVNLTSAGTWRQPVHELIPVGPLHVGVKQPQDVRGRRARLLVAGTAVAARTAAGWSRFDVNSVLDHEVVVIE